MTADKPRGPLQGIKIVDLTTVMLGPFCTQILGEMGATVIKIESPEGDVNRWTGAARTPGMSTGQLIKGRNKRSVVLNLKVPEARKPFEKLIKNDDISKKLNFDQYSPIELIIGEVIVKLVHLCITE